MTANNAPTRVAHHAPSRTSALLSPLGGQSCNCSKPARSFDQSAGFGGSLGGSGSGVRGGSTRGGCRRQQWRQFRRRLPKNICRLRGPESALQSGDPLPQIEEIRFNRNDPAPDAI